MIHLFSFYLVLDSVSSQFVSGLGFFGLECDGVDCNKQGYVIRIQKKKEELLVKLQKEKM